MGRDVSTRARRAGLRLALFWPDDLSPDLVFSHAADAHLWAVRDACRRAGPEVDACGAGIGDVAARPESLLARYDVVFAKGRAAIEALACGASVILCDATGADPLVTSRNVERLQRLNLAWKTWSSCGTCRSTAPGRD